ncbi:hypothetical protein HELRODRAFT_193489 [Helobdella robusta]|uniref:CTCK domain-containing protein n=1 Tax=Helobdella robusta TaxID=6412 RepID=T1FV16_HELRO|nr:hypothetical protein HELRODRAFT_193489 [Helobdella robusta]ESN95837.1 hypothetical protein HELRODRAFT_193489 [Helobdella robusta]
MMADQAVTYNTNIDLLDGSSKNTFVFPSDKGIPQIEFIAEKSKFVQKIVFSSKNIKSVNIVYKTPNGDTVEKIESVLQGDGNLNVNSGYSNVGTITLDLTAKNSNENLKIENLEIFTCLEGTTIPASTTQHPVTTQKPKSSTTVSQCSVNNLMDERAVQTSTTPTAAYDESEHEYVFPIESDVNVIKITASNPKTVMRINFHSENIIDIIIIFYDANNGEIWTDVKSPNSDGYFDYITNFPNVKTIELTASTRTNQQVKIEDLQIMTCAEAVTTLAIPTTTRVVATSPTTSYTPGLVIEQSTLQGSTSVKVSSKTTLIPRLTTLPIISVATKTTICKVTNALESTSTTYISDPSLASNDLRKIIFDGVAVAAIEFNLSTLQQLMNVEIGTLTNVASIKILVYLPGTNEPANQFYSQVATSSIDVSTPSSGNRVKIEFSSIDSTKQITVDDLSIWSCGILVTTVGETTTSKVTTGSVASTPKFCQVKTLPEISAFISNGAVGYIEKDGEHGATSDQEYVFIGDSIDKNSQVIVNRCYQCTCDDNNEFTCTLKNSTSNEETCLVSYCDASGNEVVYNRSSACQCGPGEVTFGQYPDCCSCAGVGTTAETRGTTLPTPIETCSVEQKYVNLSIPLKDGSVCTSNEAISLSSCRGSCGDSFDESAIYFEESSEGDDPIVHHGLCKCCRGLTGEWKLFDVNCASESKRVKIYQYTSCGCQECVAGTYTSGLPF